MWKSYTDEKANPKILRDEDYKDQARITIYSPDDTPLYEIVCGIYGLMFHTAFASTAEEAAEKYEGMKIELQEFLDSDQNSKEFCEAFTHRW